MSTSTPVLFKEMGTTPHKSGSARLWGSLAGLLSTAASLGVAELMAGLRRGGVSPVVSVGGWVIDHVPPEVKTFAVTTFGTKDKPALILGTLLLLASFVAVLGAWATTRRVVGIVGTSLFGVLGVGAAVTRPGAGWIAALPAVAGTAAGLAALVVLLHVLARHRPVSRSRTTAGEPGGESSFLRASAVDRRAFVTAGTGVLTVAALSAVGGRTLRRRFDVGGARTRLVLPPAASAAAALPAGTDLGIAGLESFVTPNSDFYRIDTALVSPQVDPATWKLDIAGMVDRPFTLTYEELLTGH